MKKGKTEAGRRLTEKNPLFVKKKVAFLFALSISLPDSDTDSTPTSLIFYRELKQASWK